ncbi:MAG: hypothetical protein C5S49_05715 [Candidatus Methanogaster sp.]|nr:MAG: hypothetical protein C5S49_05715 [ANME-2 cluster archaeon]
MLKDIFKVDHFIIFHTKHLLMMCFRTITLMISKIISTIILLFVTSIILSTPVAASPTTSVNVNTPESVDGDFSVVIGIENAVDLDAGQFDLHFDSDAVNVTGVDDGNIGGTTIPVPGWALMNKNTVRVLFNRPGIDGVSGSGSLATIHFETLVPGDCAMDISDGLLVDTMADLIPASWNGVESGVPRTKKSIPADATKSKTPGFGAISAIGLLAAAYLVFRRGR